MTAIKKIAISVGENMQKLELLCTKIELQNATIVAENNTEDILKIQELNTI